MVVLCGVVGVMYYVVNVVKVFGGVWCGEGDVNGCVCVIEGGWGVILWMGEWMCVSVCGGLIDVSVWEGVGIDDGCVCVWVGDLLLLMMMKEWEDAMKARMKAWSREGSATFVVLELMDKWVCKMRVMNIEWLVFLIVSDMWVIICVWIDANRSNFFYRMDFSR